MLQVIAMSGCGPLRQIRRKRILCTHWQIYSAVLQRLRRDILYWQRNHPAPGLVGMCHMVTKHKAALHFC